MALLAMAYHEIKGIQLSMDIAPGTHQSKCFSTKGRNRPIRTSFPAAQPSFRSMLNVKVLPADTQ